MAKVNLDNLKELTEVRLTELGVEINPNLPTIDLLSEVNPKDSREVAGRMCAIAYVIGLAYGAPSGELSSFLSKHSLWNWVSHSERNLLESPSITEKDKSECSWLAESAQALAWALGMVSLEAKSRCDDDLARKIPFKNSPTEFIESARLRPMEEIQEQVDFHYRLHWWLQECDLTGVDSGFNTGVIEARRHALDWLYGVAGDWDDISLDT